MLKLIKVTMVVILDAEEYDKRMYQLIDESPYKMTLQNPLNEMIKEAKKGTHFTLKNLNLLQYFQ
jgi:hypothetical protein